MTHIDDDTLLLYAYGESHDAARGETESHLAACAECRSRLEALELARLGAELAVGSRTPNTENRKPRRVPLTITLGAPLALAATVAALLLARGPASPPAEREPWQAHLVASPTAGYLAGGAAFMAIDSQLTQLERGGRYARQD